jgi:hypothetical protein
MKMGRRKESLDSDEVYDAWNGKTKRRSNDVKDIFDQMDEDLDE